MWRSEDPNYVSLYPLLPPWPKLASPLAWITATDLSLCFSLWPSVPLSQHNSQNNLLKEIYQITALLCSKSSNGFPFPTTGKLLTMWSPCDLTPCYFPFRSLGPPSRGLQVAHLTQWVSSSDIHKNSWLNYRLLSHTPRVSDSVALGWGW